MATNDFLVFGGGAGANVIPQVTYSGLTARTAGFSSGVAQSAQLNKVWRQSSIMSAVLAQFISDQTGQDAVDDGTTSTLLANLKIAALAMHGQCRLVKSGANVVLQPYNGNRLIIGGVPRIVPSAGVSLAPTGLTPSTTYYVYAYMNGAAMTLEASTTGRSTDAATGVEIKTGDASRTLVGQVRPLTGPVFADDYQNRLVISWFNRRNILAAGNFTTGRTTASGTPTELNSEIRNNFLCWGDEAVTMNAYGIVTLAGSPGQQASTGIAVDSSSVLYDASIQYQRDTNSNIGTATIGTSGLLSEGFHFATLLGYVSASNATWSANNFLKTIIRG